MAEIRGPSETQEIRNLRNLETPGRSRGVNRAPARANRWGENRPILGGRRHEVGRFQLKSAAAEIGPNGGGELHSGGPIPGPETAAGA